MNHTPRDTPDVPIFPPLIPLSVLIAGVVLNFLLPLRMLARAQRLRRLVAGAMALVAGIGMVISANRIFGRVGTPARPSQPTLALATTGMFTRTRNPMYLGGSLAVVGIAIGFALDWVLLLLVGSLPLVHYYIVLPEESYLERKFSDEYRRYKTKVPRYF